LIYDSFQDELRPRGHLCRRFPIPDTWPRYLGLDFGNVNMAAVFLAKEPGTGTLYLYRTYHTGGRSVAGHVEALLLGEPGIPAAVGGAKSEDEWREAFAGAGLPVSLPGVSDVEAGIGYVYAAHRRDRILVFEDLSAYRDQKMSYSRELDASGEPLLAIADKHQFHLLDAERYIVSDMEEPLTPTGFSLLGRDRPS
jgi:hypothetical protein